MLDDWVAKETIFTYIKPKAGTTAFLKYDFDISLEEFCLRLLKEKGVMLVPGRALDMEGFVRIGYSNNPKIIQKGLEKISEFIRILEKERNS